MIIKPDSSQRSGTQCPHYVYSSEPPTKIHNNQTQAKSIHERSNMCAFAASLAGAFVSIALVITTSCAGAAEVRELKGIGIPVVVGGGGEGGLPAGAITGIIIGVFILLCLLLPCCKMWVEGDCEGCCSASSPPASHTAKSQQQVRGMPTNGSGARHLSEQDKADVDRWRAIVAKGAPIPVVLALMAEEGMKKELIPRVFERVPESPGTQRIERAPESPGTQRIERAPESQGRHDITLSFQEMRAIAEFRAMLEPDEDGDRVFPPAIVVSTIRDKNLDPKLIPIVFKGYEPAECDAHISEDEIPAVRRYREMLAQGMSPVDLARVMNGEQAGERVVFLVFSEVPTPPPPASASAEQPEEIEKNAETVDSSTARSKEDENVPPEETSSNIPVSSALVEHPQEEEETVTESSVVSHGEEETIGSSKAACQEDAEQFDSEAMEEAIVRFLQKADREEGVKRSKLRKKVLKSLGLDHHDKSAQKAFLRTIKSLIKGGTVRWDSETWDVFLVSSAPAVTIKSN